MSGEPGLVDAREWEATDASFTSRHDGHSQFLKCSFIYKSVNYLFLT